MGMKRPARTPVKKTKPVSAHPCAFPDCPEPGEFRGPVRHIPESVKPFLKPAFLTDAETPHYYCKDHIKDVNKTWDFFKGMPREAIEAFNRDALTGHRKTVPSGSRLGKIRPDIIEEAYEQALGLRSGTRRPKPKQDHSTSHLPKEQREAIALLELPYPYTAKQLKDTYRALVKQHHPDAVQEKKAKKQAEDRLKRINNAYSLLRKLPIGG